jgi:hypothetical protein
MTDTSADLAVSASPTAIERRSVLRKAYVGVGHVLRSYQERVVPSQYGIPDGRLAAVARPRPKM